MNSYAIHLFDKSLAFRFARSVSVLQQVDSQTLLKIKSRLETKFQSYAETGLIDGLDLDEVGICSYTVPSQGAFKKNNLIFVDYERVVATREALSTIAEAEAQLAVCYRISSYLVIFLAPINFMLWFSFAVLQYLQINSRRVIDFTRAAEVIPLVSLVGSLIAGLIAFYGVKTLSSKLHGLYRKISDEIISIDERNRDVFQKLVSCEEKRLLNPFARKQAVAKSGEAKSSDDAREREKTTPSCSQPSTPSHIPIAHLLMSREPITKEELENNLQAKVLELITLVRAHILTVMFYQKERATTTTSTKDNSTLSCDRGDNDHISSLYDLFDFVGIFTHYDKTDGQQSRTKTKSGLDRNLSQVMLRTVNAIKLHYDRLMQDCELKDRLNRLHNKTSLEELQKFEYCLQMCADPVTNAKTNETLSIQEDNCFQELGNVLPEFLSWYFVTCFMKNQGHSRTKVSSGVAVQSDEEVSTVDIESVFSTLINDDNKSTLLPTSLMVKNKIQSISSDIAKLAYIMEIPDMVLELESQLHAAAIAKISPQKVPLRNSVAHAIFGTAVENINRYQKELSSNQHVQQKIANLNELCQRSELINKGLNVAICFGFLFCQSLWAISVYRNIFWIKKFA